MNDLLRPQQIIDSPFINGEINSSKGKRSGYNIFMMHCRHQFQNYSYEERKNLLILHHLHDIEQYERHEEHPRRHLEPAHGYTMIQKIAVTMWKYRLPPDIKQAWKDRAIRVNAHPPYGQHATIPNIVNNQQAILNSINYSFKDFVSYMRPLIRDDRRNGNPRTQMKANYSRKFGNEKVLMGKQIFCSFFLNHLLFLTFFGDWHNPSFLKFELIESTKSTKLIHIGAATRLREMVCVNRLSAFYFEGWNASQEYTQSYFIAGKAVLMNGVTHGEVVGYVIEESNEKLKIKIDSSIIEIVELSRPIYNCKEGNFLYTNLPTDLYKWIEYNPIRMKIYRRGWVQFSINRILINKDDDIIINI